MKWGDQDRGKRGWLSAVVLAIALLFVGWFFYANQRPIATLPTPPVAPVVIPVLPVTDEEKPPALVVEPPAVEIPPKEEPMAPEEPPVVEVPPEEEKPPAPVVEPIVAPIPLPQEFWGKASSSSPPTIIREQDQILFNASWNVPTGTVIFAPFAGEIVFLSVTLKEEASRDILGLLGESGESWQSFMIFAYYDFKPLVEQGQKVKAGDPLVQVVDREIKLEFASSLQSQQIDETNKWYNLLVGIYRDK